MISSFLCTKVDKQKRVLHLSNGSKTVIVPIYSSVNVQGGVIHLSGTVKVAEWTHDIIGRKFDKIEYETWNSPDVKQARTNFVNLCHRFKGE